MLLIDGVRYELWTPPSEDEFEQVVKEHSREVFGENSVYIDIKHKIKSLAGVGSIPDGLVIVFGNVPEWHIAEVELSSHDPYGHIVPQVDRFLNGIDNRDTRNKIIEALYDAIYGDDFLKLKTRQAIGLDKDVHKFLADLIARTPTITIIIEEYTSQLKEALKKYSQKKVVEFRTYRREKAEAVHAHLFEPLFQLAGTIPIEVREWPGARGMKLYIKDGKHYNPMEALVALGATLIRMVEGRGDRRATMPDGTILEYVGSTKNGKSKIAKVHAYLLDHGFTFSQGE